MGFMEISLILIVAVIALGPEKLPQAAVDIAKFLKKMKTEVSSAKETLDSQIQISSMREESQKIQDSLKKSIDMSSLDDVTSVVDDVKNIVTTDKISLDTTKEKKKKKKS
jgi:sec-independent protein translocase protein TatB